MILSCAEKLELVVVVGLYYRVHLSGKDVGEMLHLESLRQCLDEFHDHCHLLASVELFLRVQTVVACTAVLDLISFTEVVEQQLPAA